MSLQPPDNKYFDVVGSGYVPENHADEKHRHFVTSESKAIGGAMVWLAFYILALAVVVVTNFDKVTDVVVAMTK